jgi:hypothetical protein
VIPSQDITALLLLDVRLLFDTACSIWWMLLPPIHVWMPNQPQATRARDKDGRLDPLMPKLALASTGNGICAATAAAGHAHR